MDNPGGLTNVTLPTPNVRSGYKFDGWYTAQTGGTKVGNAGGSYAPAANTTLYAHWTEKPIYTIKLDDLITNDEEQMQKVYEKYGEGVYLDENCTQKMTTSENPITKPEKKYTVTYNYNGSGQANGSAELAYVFDGYHKGDFTLLIDSNGYITNNFTNTLYSEDTYMYANWSNGTTILPNATRTGYSFDGWYTDAEGGTKVGDAGANYTTSSDRTLYAHWTPVTVQEYTITLNVDDTTTAGTLELKEIYGDGIYNGTNKMTPTENPITVPRKESIITFNYNDNSSTLMSTGLMERLILNANLGRSNTTQTVSEIFWGYGEQGSNVKLIDENGYITDAFTSTSFTNDITLYPQWNGRTNITTPNPTRDGYTFDGWYDSAVGGNRIVGGNESYTNGNNITLYAHWTENNVPEKRTIVFRDEDGNIIATIEVENDEDIEYPGQTPTKPDKDGYRYEFVKWEKVVNDETGEEEYVAKFEKIAIEYTITYKNVEGVEFERENPTKYTVETENFTLCNPTAKGYTFQGWRETGKEDILTEVTIEKGTIGNKEFTAIWTANKNTKYKVEHYKQKSDGTYSEKADETEEFEGTTQTEVTAKEKEYSGYEVDSSKSVLTGKVEGDGSLVLKVYYKKVEEQKTPSTNTNKNTKNTYSDLTSKTYVPSTDNTTSTKVLSKTGITGKTIVVGIMIIIATVLTIIVRKKENKQ